MAEAVNAEHEEHHGPFDPELMHEIERFALVPLVIFTSRRELMGSLVNTRLTAVAAWAIAGIIICLNVFLLYETFLGG